MSKENENVLWCIAHSHSHQENWKKHKNIKVNRKFGKAEDALGKATEAYIIMSKLQGGFFCADISKAFDT